MKNIRQIEIWQQEKNRKSTSKHKSNKGLEISDIHRTEQILYLDTARTQMN